MFCLRSWLPILFIPTNASPAFVFLFFVCTYFLNRPCVYCSILLLVLFLTSCNWSDRCFFDFSSNWFQPRPCASCTEAPETAPAATSFFNPAESIGGVAVEMVDTTARALARAAASQVAAKRAEWTGLGLEWLRSLLGRREWRIDCMDIYIQL